MTPFFVQKEVLSDKIIIWVKYGIIMIFSLKKVDDFKLENKSERKKKPQLLCIWLTLAPEISARNILEQTIFGPTEVPTHAYSISLNVSTKRHFNTGMFWDKVILALGHFSRRIFWHEDILAPCQHEHFCWLSYL